ncbi:MAG: DUF4367 domain-containing protein [Ruminococcaceae bacterium]|nr:DUF4367 domain-containing protein [Oscillospiraceae bacterium]
MNESERNSNIDALITLSAKSLIDEDLEMMIPAEDDVEVPPRVHRKILRKIRNYDKKSEMPKAYIYVRRIAAVFLIICSISFVFCLSVEAIRTEIWNTIIDWYEEYVEIHFENNGAVANVIEEYKEPSFVPDGFERQIMLQSPVNYIIYYNVDEQRNISFTQRLMHKGATLQLDSTDCEIKEIEIRGYQAKLFEYHNGLITLCWHDDKYFYCFSSNYGLLDSSLIIKMAESVE